MFMPISDDKVILDVEFKIAEEEKNLFLISIIGTTIQDGSIREKRD